MKEKLSKALGIFIDTMRQQVKAIIAQKYPDSSWEDVYYNALNTNTQNQWNIYSHSLSEGDDMTKHIDYWSLGSFIKGMQNDLQPFLSFKNANKLYSIIMELKDTRNDVSHFVPLSDEQIERAFSNLKTCADLCNLQDLKEEIVRLSKKTVATEAPAAVVSSSQVTTTTDTAIPDYTDKLTPWFLNAIPHYDIRNGILDESRFAANLDDVANDRGIEVYRDYFSFFEKTYITQGLRDISTRAVRALNGEESENRVISLQTGFGGGKTHNMISLYHIARNGRRLADSKVCEGLFSDGVAPKYEHANVAVFTHHTTDVSQGREAADGIRINTLWGEIAYQLGGVEAYNKVRPNDEERIAPSASLMKDIISDAAPCLILIDELADYCVRANAKKVGGGTLFEQTNSFMQTITEVVASVPRSLLVVSLPASISEVGAGELGQKVLTSLQERVVRVAASARAVENEEIFEVIRRRLFESFADPTMIDKVASQYKSMYHNRRTDLPNEADKIEYANRIRMSYPFHPELINVFHTVWGSDSRFQRTRGVLRLLASIVNDLWKRRQNLAGSNALIHTSDVCLENLPALTGTITDLMGSQWETVMHADVYGGVCNAVKIDNEDPTSNIGQYHLTQGLATTILMNSISTTKRNNMDMKSLKLCVLRPQAFNHIDVDGAMNKLEQVAHYLYATSGTKTYYFQSKPNINILVNQTKANITTAEINAEIIHRIQSSVNFVNNIRVMVNPSGDVPEQKQLTLIVLGPEHAVSFGNIAPATKSYITGIATKKGATDRIYRNTILFLVSSEAGRATLYDKVRDFLSCGKTLEEFGPQLDNDQKREIQSRKTNYASEIESALIRAYNTAIRHSVSKGLELYEMHNFGTSFSSQISSNFIGEISDEVWLLDKVGKVALSKANLLPTIDEPVQVCKLYDAFLRFDDKPMILNSDAIKLSILRYCQEGLFNVGVRNAEKYTRIYHMENVPFLDVTDDSYYLLDPSVVLEPEKPDQPEEGQNSTSGGNQTGDGEGEGGTDIPGGDTTTDKEKTFKKVTISGQVPLENWTQLFTSFVTMLKSNHLKIDVKFTAKSTDANPLKETSATYKSIKESASQLGLDFEPEE